MANGSSGSRYAVIFDVDGTLIDSVDFHARAWVDAFADFGHAVAFDKVRRQIGKGGDQLMPMFLSREEIEQTGKALETHRGNLLKERYLSQFRAFPKVRELVQRVLDDGARVALGSSAKEDELAEYKKIAGIEDLIDTETSSDDAEHSKPCADIFEAAIKKLGITDLTRILVVGDTPYDAQAALKAGLQTIGLRCGGWSADELRGAGCVTVFDDPADLLAHYDTSPLARLSRPLTPA
ncbi:MAG: HAD family hydrolase [Reyranella sp.]|uniref:HAD family hydrolase n=1 Tax=Reyranella sp. TaxID=1929291 RepID=UPI0012145F96|nr:HAD family hydrolase [Reyranella sp.]TAJ96693.1 MAG: HAD family hydrolase [Reyranella sp.]TBR27194.1 MAG: HAD family hydrolase [Reyranella sp.]